MKTKLAEKHHIGIDIMTKTDTKTIVGLLNQALANALNLKLQAKQAHWNIKGENFIALHELFDKVAGEVDGYADLLAERVAQLGSIAEGTLEYVNKATDLDTYPGNTHDVHKHVEALAKNIAKFAAGTRELISQAAEAKDDVTADICTEVTRGMDMLHWFVSAHAA